jgi:hypothetical protein
VRDAREGLGPHRVRCQGACAKPGFRVRRYTKGPRAGQVDRLPRCPGCADPCPRGCTDHVDALRLVEQYVEVEWFETPGDPTSRRHTRRQCASVMLLGTVARRFEREAASRCDVPRESRSETASRREGRISHSGSSSAKHPKSRDAVGKESPPATAIRPPAGGLPGDAGVTPGVTRNAPPGGLTRGGGPILPPGGCPLVRAAAEAAFASWEALRGPEAPPDPPAEKRAPARAPILLERDGRPGGDA